MSAACARQHALSCVRFVCDIVNRPNQLFDRFLLVQSTCNRVWWWSARYCTVGLALYAVSWAVSRARRVRKAALIGLEATPDLAIIRLQKSDKTPLTGHMCAPHFSSPMCAIVRLVELGQEGHCTRSCLKHSCVNVSKVPARVQGV